MIPNAHGTERIDSDTAHAHTHTQTQTHRYTNTPAHKLTNKDEMTGTIGFCSFAPSYSWDGVMKIADFIQEYAPFRYVNGKLMNTLRGKRPIRFVRTLCTAITFLRGMESCPPSFHVNKRRRKNGVQKL